MAIPLASILPNADASQLGRSYIVCLCLVFVGFSVPFIQPLPLPALGLSETMTSCRVPQPCTTAATAAIAPARSSSLILVSVPTPSRGRHKDCRLQYYRFGHQPQGCDSFAQAWGDGLLFVGVCTARVTFENEPNSRSLGPSARHLLNFHHARLFFCFS